MRQFTYKTLIECIEQIESLKGVGLNRIEDYEIEMLLFNGVYENTDLNFEVMHDPYMKDDCVMDYVDGLFGTEDNN